jgi:hypothetical protein
MARKKQQSPEEFWADYEKRIGEKVLSFHLGKYISGWPAFDAPNGLWGLIMATGGGFRFHHFPHEGWLQAVTRVTTGAEAPSEKTIFIPLSRIVRSELRVQKGWLKKIFFSRPPVLVIRYLGENGTEQELLAETEYKAAAMIQHLKGNA